MDLQEWVEPLNRIDASLSFYIQKYPRLLLIAPIERSNSKNGSKAPKTNVPKIAETIEEVKSVPDTVRKNIMVILKFLSGLLTNSSNKTVFNSVDELVDLLAAADDDIASHALETLCSLALPPSLHKQQVPEIQQHSSALHVSKSASHKRLTALARGWGTRGSGLGLFTCATSDDSVFGQGALPQQAGELNFTFFRSYSAAETKTEKEIDESSLVNIHLPASRFAEDSEMTVDAAMRSSDDDSTSSKQKWRRVALTTKVERTIRSTADLFFECLRQGGGVESIPSDRLFPLLADIRLTRSFYCQATRVAAIERRLRALITILHAHPSQEVMSGYFQAQPEICVELVDLLRPTVSSGAVSAGASDSHAAHNQDNIAALANSPVVPYQVRELALQSLTALAARREGSNGALQGFARHSNILSELGVGKGQYLGLLPTLIRYSLAALGSLVSSSTLAESQLDPYPESSTEESMAMDIGLAFIEATSTPPLPRLEQLERALVFIDSVLTLTSAIVSTPSGTSSLTECGLVPALLNTVSIDTEKVVIDIAPETSSTSELLRIQSLLRFVTAQAVQILEGAIVTHNNALSAFHNLKGVEVLTTRLSKEVLSARDSRIKNLSENGCTPMDIDNSMEIESSSFSDIGPRASQRVLLFGIVTCLTVVFHQESTSSSVTTPSGTAEIQKPELTKALVEILDNVDLYGGHLASLISTLLSDVMNSDPHVVRYVHESGLASSFLKMLDIGPSGEPIPPAVPELVMSIPTVLAALALTEFGAKKLQEHDPFPGLLKLFHHPKYAMPKSCCLLNEMTSIVGTGLDEIMRHVPSLSKPICKAISNAMMQVVAYGDEVIAKELSSYPEDGQSAEPFDIDHERSCLIQYCLNFGQILEQILHNEEHCGPFVEAGGLDAILAMYPYLMPTSDRFLAHISCLSCPSLSTITHSTTEEALTLAFKCIALRYSPAKLIEKTLKATKEHMEKLKIAQNEMRSAFPSEKLTAENKLDAAFVLDGLPSLSICDITDPSFDSKKASLANYLRAAIIVQWLAGLLSAVIQASYQRSAESGPAWNPTEREWKKQFPSVDFQEVFGSLSLFFQSSILEACRVRAEEGFENRELQRQRSNASKRMHYKLRVVCPEGAVVRDGIEIDSCANVGSMEMGEIVESFDRCVNSSGVLRYRTQRGWLSEQTRGHGREPIAEVLAVWKSNVDDDRGKSDRDSKGRIEDGIPDIRSSSANVLARMQSVYAELYTSLLRLSLQSFSLVSARSISFDQGTLGGHISSVMKMLSAGIRKGFARREVLLAIQSSSESGSKDNKFGVALYLGSLLSHLQTCLFEEKRDKQVVNMPLLISLSREHLGSFEKESDDSVTSDANFFDAIKLIFELCLVDFQSRGEKLTGEIGTKNPHQRLDRTTASFLPPATTLLRRLISSPSSVSSQMTSLLGKLKESDVLTLVGRNDLTGKASDVNESALFELQNFTRRLLCRTSDVITKPWVDPRLVNAPPHVFHPFSTLVSETMIALEGSSKKSSARTSAGNSREQPYEPFRNLLAGLRAAPSRSNRNDDFEPSEEAISRLMEMGFSRDHAWDAIDRTRSNQLEIAMEYALSNPPASAESVSRRRAERERRRNERREQAQQEESVQQESETSGSNQPNQDGDQSDSNAGAMEVDQAPSEKDAKDVTKSPLEQSIEMVSERLGSWKLKSANVACNILSEREYDMVTAKSQGDGESEALTTVVSSFLLDLYQRYPDDKDQIVGEILGRLKTRMEKAEDADTTFWKISSGRESSAASLFHCTLLFVRALPKIRTLLLQKGLVKATISIIENHCSSTDFKNKSEATKWPIWLPSALLLLDIMAQPLVAFPETKDITTKSEDEIFDEEFYVVKKDHERQTSSIASLTSRLFTALSKGSEADHIDSKSKKNENLAAAPLGEESADKSEESTSASIGNKMIFGSVPAYFPLIPAQSVDTCTKICLNLLADESKSIPPGVTHAVLLLLMRLLRSPKTSAQCLKAGVGQKLLRLKRRCRFNGHSGLIALIFRRLLEDEITLQSAMETEIRNIMVKLDGKKEKNASGNKDTIRVSRKAFLKAVTPILCRDPACFVKAMAVSVLFEKSNSDSSGQVVMLTSTQRSKNIEIVSDLLKLKQPHFSSSRVSTVKRSSFGKSKKHSSTSSGTRSKTPTRQTKRNQTPKRGKKEKIESKENAHEDLHKHATHQISSIQNIIGLLLNHIIQTAVPSSPEKNAPEKSQKNDFDFGYETSFLWTANILEILADLVLAMPACATAIHKFKPSRKSRSSAFSSMNNALQGCPSPPRTFVSFLLHGLLSQDRWNQKLKAQEDQSESKQVNDLEKLQKKITLLRTKVVQSTARLLVALVARPGEGRRRVVVELIFALSGGQLGLTPASSFRPVTSSLTPRQSELHALQSWGELCIGFVAPKSNGSNHDSNNALSFEVIKIMLENGMAHSLLIAIHRVPLFHPMAANALGSLVLPFEILTRGSVADSVKPIIEKERKAREDKDIAKSNKQSSSKDKSSHKRDSFIADDHMLEDAFAAEAPRNRSSTEESFDEEEIVIDDNDRVMVDVDDDGADMDVDDDVDEEVSDEEMSSSSESSDSSDVDDSDDDNSDDDSGNSDDDSIDDDEEEESILDDIEESDDAHSRGDFEDDPFNLDASVVDEEIEFDTINDGGRDRAENQTEEGWTRVDASGLNGMVLGGRRGIGQHLSGSATGRSRGFIDAAEAMIGTLLRTGEIRTEALAELEGQLGIQIVPAGGRGSASSSVRRPFGSVMSRQARAESNRSGSREIVGIVPQINQRSQPDLGYSTMGRGSRWNEINPMEYVYGGPCITAGHRHYDLLSPVVEPDTDTLNLSSSEPGDAQLFPGGPAASTHARSRYSVHPLLSDVDLPPINALVSDLQPHGIRSIASNTQPNSRLGEWTTPNSNSSGFYISNASGTVVRSNRMLGNVPNRSGNFGWTDHDGLPFDATVEQFSSAFDNALGETMLAASPNNEQRREPAISEETDENQSAERPQVESADEENEDESNSIQQEEESSPMEEEPSQDAVQRSEDENEVEAEEEQDGDGVASSLAVGLRLSPSSDPSPEGGRASTSGNEVANADPDQQNEESTSEQQEEEPVNAEEPAADTSDGVPNGNGLVCPAGMDPEVFNVLPLEMQQEVVNQARETTELANQLDAGSSLDPEALAALPEEMRREVIEQEQRERRSREQPPADPSNAEEMDNASFVASLAPDLRNEILSTADPAFLATLPESIQAEARILQERDRARVNHRANAEQVAQANQRESSNGQNAVSRSNQQSQATNGRENTSSRRKQRTGKIRVELERKDIIFTNDKSPTQMSSLVAKSDLKALVRLMYLLAPVRPHRILQKVFQNIAQNSNLRLILSSTFLNLLNDRKTGALCALDRVDTLYNGSDDWRKKVDGLFQGSLQDFPPALLIGAAPEVLETERSRSNLLMIRRRQTSDTVASIAANLPISSRGSRHEEYLPPVVSTRILDTLLQMCKNSQRFCLDMLVKGIIIHSDSEMVSPTGFESLLDLLEKSRYIKSSASLEQLLNLLEFVVSPLSHMPKIGEEDVETTQKDIDEAASQGKELLNVPRVVVSQERLKLLCSILRMEICRDAAFTKVNTIARRLCRIDANRGYVLAELASVARALGHDATRDLTALNIRISATVNKNEGTSQRLDEDGSSKSIGGAASTSVAVSTSTSELKLLRVLQTLQGLCTVTPDDGSSKKDGPVIVTGELVQLLEAMNLDGLWSELTSCLKIVQVLEGVSIEEDADKDGVDNSADEGADENENGEKKKLENSVAGLLTRFLPSIEAFFVANGCFTRAMKEGKSNAEDQHLVGGKRLFDFVEANKILLNALVRNNAGLLEKGLKALIQLPRCRMLLDFDVKRHWFKLQVRRLRQQANRRYGSIRLHIRRDHVFEDAYHQLCLRNADEMRGRLHITFRNEQGVDAGGLSREFFGILAKEIFNPNYALFTSTEDGCTFQPNPNSNVNPDHLSYFRFVGRIVGKAVADGYLLDSHFTRSLYKHMLGQEPTHHDMEAIDPDYYKNLKTILEYNLGDLCLDLTFSVEDHSFGRNQIIDLIPNGRNIPVTEDNKAKYVSLVCQNRMTTAISSQIKAYLDGFYELVSKDLIQIFTPRELELLISGLPDIDIHDLKKNTDYNGWKATDKQIEWFWNVLFSLSRNQKAAFLQFVTGSSKVPLAGFGELPGMRGVQKFSIHKAGGSAGALMSAHTCFNSLDLPEYKSEQELRDKLLYAIHEGASGFLMA